MDKMRDAAARGAAESSALQAKPATTSGGACDYEERQKHLESLLGSALRKSGY